MNLKSFKQHLEEDIQRSEIQELYNKFKTKFESIFKAKYPNKKFEVVDPVHMFTQAMSRSNRVIDRNPLTLEELERIFDTIIDRFFRASPNGIAQITSPNAFMLSPTKNWDFQHKFFTGNYFRCILYSVKLIIQNVRDEKSGKVKEVIVEKPEFSFITIFPSNSDSMDNPKYKHTNRLIEGISKDTLNYLED